MALVVRGRPVVMRLTPASAVLITTAEEVQRALGSPVHAHPTHCAWSK